MNRLKFIVMAYVGFTSYITIETLFRGHSYSYMGILGALSLLIIGQINNKISWNMDLLLQGLIGSIVITLMEFIVGKIDKLYLHIGMWNYSNMIGNVDGVICPLFSFLWFLLSIVAIFLADFIDYYLLGLKQVPYYKIFGKKIFQFPKKKVIY